IQLKNTDEHSNGDRQRPLRQWQGFAWRSFGMLINLEVSRTTTIPAQLGLRVPARHRGSESRSLIPIQAAPEVLVRHQEDKGAHIFFGSPVPVPQKDRVDHQPSFALAKQEVSDGLSHQVAPRQANEDRYWVNGLADECDGVGNGNGSQDLADVIVIFLLKGNL